MCCKWVCNNRSKTMTIKMPKVMHQFYRVTPVKQNTHTTLYVKCMYVCELSISPSYCYICFLFLLKHTLVISLLLLLHVNCHCCSGRVTKQKRTLLLLFFCFCFFFCKQQHWELVYLGYFRMCVCVCFLVFFFLFVLFIWKRIKSSRTHT